MTHTILHAIAECSAVRTQTIADKAGVSYQTITRELKRLIEAGLIEKQGEHNRRRLFLADAGMKAAGLETLPIERPHLSEVEKSVLALVNWIPIVTNKHIGEIIDRHWETARDIVNRLTALDLIEIHGKTVARKITLTDFGREILATF